MAVQAGTVVSARSVRGLGRSEQGGFYRRSGDTPNRLPDVVWGDCGAGKHRQLG
ncbi:MAG: hypothetical protein LUQ06_01385 [Methylococcaceae bacterium]|nr:hypothetical protein [Methylococcaceae bacterium]